METLLNDVDVLLTKLEDYTHGSDGMEITRMRKRISEYHVRTITQSVPLTLVFEFIKWISDNNYTVDSETPDWMTETYWVKDKFPCGTTSDLYKLFIKTTQI